tara:strand:+ start:83 stop:448 length:366 start_codon:yes stop_codon:yes gene_type:complete
MTQAVTLADNASLMTTPSGTAPAYLCRAWVNFNGTGTVAIRASGNVSSITDNSTGQYTVNFTTAMSDANYSTVFGQGGLSYGGTAFIRAGLTTTSSIGIASYNITNTTYEDANPFNVSIFR